MQTSAHIDVSVDYLIRHEWGNLVAVLTKVFGAHNLQLAEDVVQDTFVKAINNWTIHGLPDNPVAWLFTVARNKATDVIRKQKREYEYADHIAALLQSEYSLSPTLSHLVNDDKLDDDKLRMMFVCCHPSLSIEASVSLVLKTLCGLTVTEIAKAFLTGYNTIEKRLYRAKQTLKENKITLELPANKDLQARLSRVLLCIYLLFNEAYNSTQHESLVRTDLMQEAMQLCELVCRNNAVPNEEANALMALMCFTAARNKTRLDCDGNILLLKHQDRSKWNHELIKAGIEHLENSATGTTVTRYHLEAGIAYEHAKAKQYEHTDWQGIIHCYDLLIHTQQNPIAELNRAIAISEWLGAAAGIKAIETINGIAILSNYYLLHATLGELNYQLTHYGKAKAFFEQAMPLTKSAAEKTFLKKKIAIVTKQLAGQSTCQKKEP